MPHCGSGNVLGIKNNPTATGVKVDRQCFDYDGLRRLTNAWTPSNGDCATSNRTVAGLGGGDGRQDGLEDGPAA